MVHKIPPLIVFYDGGCGLCHFAVQWIAARDTRNKFVFAPLGGQTAQQLLPKELPDTLVLCENGKLSFFAKGAFKICGYLPYPWHALGFLGSLPEWLINPIYRLVARHRSGLFTPPKGERPKEIPPSKFLP